MTTTQLIEAIKGMDEKARGHAWQTAGPIGAVAVTALAELMASDEMEPARAAKRALWNIVRHAGRPKSGAEKEAVVAQLLPLLNKGNVNVRRELVWMLSEIGDDDAVGPIAQLLNDTELREDARAALQRIPGRKSLRALKTAFESGAEDHKRAIAVSLRVRGEKVRTHPAEKLVPTKKSNVKATVPA